MFSSRKLAWRVCFKFLPVRIELVRHGRLKTAPPPPPGGRNVCNGGHGMLRHSQKHCKLLSQNLVKQGCIRTETSDIPVKVIPGTEGDFELNIPSSNWQTKRCSLTRTESRGSICQKYLESTGLAHSQEFKRFLYLRCREPKEGRCYAKIMWLAAKMKRQQIQLGICEWT